METAMARREKRTLKKYQELFHNPFRLFGHRGTDNNSGPSVLLFPNGESEIWIQGQRGKGYRITASEGLAGLGLTISTFVGAPPMTVSGNASGDYAPITNVPDAREMSLCQYNSDDRSQQF